MGTVKSVQNGRRGRHHSQTEFPINETSKWESDERLRAVLGNSLEAIVVIDGEGKLIYVSPSFEFMLGWAPEDHVGQSLYVRVHEDDLASAADMFDALKRTSGAKVHVEMKVWHKDGSFRVVEVAGQNLLDNPAIASIVVNIRDITERKQAEEALKESEQQLTAVLSNVADAVFRFKEGKLIWCNTKIYDMLGYDTDELVGVDLDSVFPSDVSLSDIYKVVDVGLKEQGYFQGTTKVRKKDGSVVFVEYTASPIPGKDPLELVGVARDVTERKAMEEALKRSEEHFRALIENSMDAVAIVDVDGTIKYESPSVERMLGYRPEEMVGRNALEFIHPDDVNQISFAFQDSAKNPGRLMSTELRFLHKDGSWRIIEGVGNNLLDNPRVNGIVANYRDVTERKMMEQQIQLAGRLAAVGELAAGVAHELNNPLTAVQAYAEMLKDRDDLDLNTRNDICTIHSQALRAARITENLLSFCRKHKPEKSLVSINEILEKSLELHVYRLNVSNVILVVELDSDIPKTMADCNQLQQVFVNLVTNAEQAMIEAHGGGTLRIQSKQQGNVIQIIFTDDGPGISQDNLQRLFDPFFTTKDVGKGTGLGLSICYGIIHEHNGRLYANSNGRDGTEFVVEIPIITQ